MRVTISHANLSAALDTASRAAGKPQPLPILGYVLIEATPDGGLSATGTDLKTRAWRTVDAMIEEAGAVAIPPKAVLDFLDAVPADLPISLSVDAGHRATLQAGRTTARISGMHPDQYPDAPEIDDWAAEVSLWPDALKTLIDSVAFAAAGDETRPALSGVHLQIAGGYLTLTAADGLRLARRRMELDGPELSVIVPAERLARVAAGLAGAKGEVRLAVDARGRYLLADAETGTWAISLLEGNYPDLSRQLQQAPVTTVTVARSDMLRACRLVGNLLVDITGTDGKSVSRVGKAVLEIAADSVTIRAGDAQADHEAVTVIDAAVEPAVSDDGPVLCALNSGALREACEALDGSIALELCGPGKSVFLRAAGGARADQCSLIQPLAVPNTSQRG